MNNVLLKRYIRTVLLNEDFGISGDSDLGLDFTNGDPKKLYKIFLEPFVDVFSTAAGETKQLSQKLQTLGKVAFQTIGTTILPMFQDDYEEIFANEKQQIDKIKNQYQDVYSRTWTAIKDADVMAAAFMYDPAGLFTTKVLKHSPNQVMNLLNILTGGSLDNAISKLKQKSGKNEKFDASSIEKFFNNTDESVRTGRPLLIERNLEVKSKIKELIGDNPTVQRMQADMKGVVRNSLEKIFDKANSIGKARSVEELAKAINKNIPELKKIQALQEPERSQVEQKLLQAIKGSMKSFYVKQLTDKVKNAIESGVPSDHAYLNDLKSAIQKIKNI